MKTTDILWTSKEAAAVTGGVCTQSWAATGVCVNVEEVRKGDLFVATEARELEKAYKKGAVVAVVSHVSEDMNIAIPLLKVPDSYEALRDLARAARFRTHAMIVGVQGIETRHQVAEFFKNLGPMHDGGKILSLGMANMPEDYDFGVFGLAPSVRPDIAIVFDGATSIRDGLFQSMPKGASVLLNADCPEYFNMMARVKAVKGLNVFSFGRAAHADARISDEVVAHNGTRVTLEVMGESLTLILPANQEYMMAASCLATKLCGKNIHTAIRQIKPASSLRQQIEGLSVSLFDAVPKIRQMKMPQAVFRVQNMIDLGFGRQTAILDNVSFPGRLQQDHGKGLSIPAKIANLDVIYTGRRFATVPNAYDAIRSMNIQAKIEEIVPEVIVPGDFIVFEQAEQKPQAAFAEALRLKPKVKQKRRHNTHAL